MITIKTKYNYDCDVLIVGGGPGGSALAYHLGKCGLKVLVVDAGKFPRDKVCGDGVSPVALAELHRMGITRTEKFKKANEINKVGLFIKNDKVVIPLTKPANLPFHARIIPRIELDYWIYEAARKAGAGYLEEARFEKYRIESGAAIAEINHKGRKVIITSRMIVGADGSRSSVARQMHGTSFNEEFQLLGLRSYFKNVNGPTDRVDIYFSKDSFPGIYWMFPKGKDGANIGMAMVSSTVPDKPEKVRELLAKHISENENIRMRIGNGTIEGKISGWPINFFNPLNSITGERILLVGDAAGLINPLSGDGIQYALLSARWASEIIAESVKNNDFSAASLFQYRETVNKELAYDFAFSNLLVQFGRNKALSGLWMEIMAALVSMAKADREYADTIAGIFEGTYPSHKALSVSFIQKSVLQAGASLLQGGVNASKDRIAAANFTFGLMESTINLLENVRDNPYSHIRWARQIFNKTFDVAGHAIRGVIGK